MFQKNNDRLRGRFLQEALPLVSTYFSGESVSLSGNSTLVGEIFTDDVSAFEHHIKFRHSIACCNELFQIIQKIEAGFSNFTTTERVDTKGVIRGRLDIPKYVINRANSFSWPKTYPIIVTTDTPNTPENALAVRVLRTVLQRLSNFNAPLSSAESLLGRKCKNWISARLNRSPWSEITAVSALPRLFQEASRRISRRQTGNENSYQALMTFIENWHFLNDMQFGKENASNFVNSLLTFPADEAFDDRIYEIWCIKSIANTFEELGATIISNPTPMFESKTKPIYVLKLDSNLIELWFQQPLPYSNAEWFYESTSAFLRGIPDITIVLNGKHRLLFDAKNKLVTTTTRSEETYKMLGYYENFQTALNQKNSWAVIAFVSNSGFSRSLKSNIGRRLELISAHPSSSTECQFSGKLKPILRSWIDLSLIQT